MPAYDKLAFFFMELAVFINWHNFRLGAYSNNELIN